MKKLIKIYDRFDVVIVPFPFIDSAASKRRPALVLSSAKHFNSEIDACILAMITSSLHSPWPLDIEINDLASSGLPSESLIRMKLFTLDHKLILKKIGKLGKKDQQVVSKNLELLFEIT